MNAGTQKKRQSPLVNRHSKGFTLVELTAAATLLALLTAASFITYAQTWKHWALRQDAQRFYLAARYARVLAIESQRSCQLMIDPDSNSYYIVQAADETEAAAQVSNLWHRPTRLDDAVSFDRVMTMQTVTAGAPGGITFRPDGSADAAMVQFGNGERYFTVQISAATARAAIVAGAVDAYQSDQIDLDDMQ